ncbi:EamA family transporter [Desulfarculus baarsii]
MSWFLLALGSALGMAIADYFTKRHLSDLPVNQAVMARIFGLLPAPVVILAVTPWPAVGADFAWPVLLALPLEVAALFLYLRAMAIAPLGLVQPFFATTPLFVMLTGLPILGERPTWAGAAGVLAMAAGGYVVNLHQARHGWLEPIKAIGRQRGVLLALAAAAIYSLTAVLGKAAVNASNPWFMAGVYPLLVALALAAAARARGPIGWAWLRRPWGLAGVSCGVAVMMVCHFMAIAVAPAAYMLAVKRGGAILAVLLGGVLLGEGHLAQRLAACALVVAGGALIVAFG